MEWIYWTLGGLLVCGLAFTLAVAYLVDRVLFVRTAPDKWEKETAKLNDPQIDQMNAEGAAWAAKYAAFGREVSVQSGKETLFGEYFDFGYKKAVIVLAGRMEDHRYGYYFAAPYQKAGYNLLTVDNRGHGKSGGRRGCVGFREQADLLAWGRLLHDRLGVESIVVHGICIGGCTGIFALTRPDCPDYFRALVTEGLYTSFYHSFVNHMVVQGRPIFPVAIETMLFTGLFSGGDPIFDGPARRMKRLDRPALFLHSRADEYSLFASSEKMYAACKAPHRTAFFDKGGHSKVRVNNRQGYDEAIAAFLAEPELGVSAELSA